MTLPEIAPECATECAEGECYAPRTHLGCGGCCGCLGPCALAYLAYRESFRDLLLEVKA